MEGKLLSIIIPTYNRGNVLPYTLALFEEQVERNSTDVELIVCDNASTDNTLEVLTHLNREKKWFSFVHYEDHVDIGPSIMRSANNAQGRFILLFGDDDIPAPMLVGTLLTTINENPNVGAIVLNKMDGFSQEIESVFGLYLSEGGNTFDKYKRYYTDIQQFAKDNYYKLGFLSADVINRECWKNGESEISNKHLGYEFVYQILNGVKKSVNIYMSWPLVIQRNPIGDKGIQHAFKPNWPLYAYIGIPRLLIDLEKSNLINNWREAFRDNQFNANDKLYFGTIISSIRGCQISVLHGYIDELCHYQDGHFRIKYSRLLISSHGLWKYLLIAWVKFLLDPIAFLVSIPSKLRNRLKKKY